MTCRRCKYGLQTSSMDLQMRVNFPALLITVQHPVLATLQPCLRGFEDSWNPRVFELGTSEHHLRHSFGRQEDPGHSMASKPSEDELSWFIGNLSDVWEAVGGVSHDYLLFPVNVSQVSSLAQ